jgi:hypothetical protein
MSDVQARLTRLIELAMQSAPEQQRALAFELCDLLVEWPARYAPAMREPFEALLEKVLRRLDDTTRQLIAGRIAARANAAIPLLNAIYLDVPVEAQATILRHNAELDDGIFVPTDSSEGDETILLAAARAVRGPDFAVAFARFLRISEQTAKRILDDECGNALAVACKGAHIRRATFSALALLTAARLRTDPAARYAFLCAFDDIPESGAARLVHSWRMTRDDHSLVEADARAA